MSGVDDVLLFNESFSSTNPIASEECSVSKAMFGSAIFVTAIDVDVTIDIQVQDPLGEWRTVDTNTSTDGTTDAIPIQCNMGRFRVLVTPASAAGSAVVWTHAFGG